MAAENDPPPPEAKSMQPETSATEIKKVLIGSIRPLFFILLGLAVFWFISGQIRSENSILAELNETATARGLITFVVATSTIAAAIILVLAAIISEGAENDVKMRLNEGRQVLAPLIGILGTIVGFYFGQPTVVSGQPGAGTGQIQPLTIGALTTSAPQVSPGGLVTVASTVSGGRPPYTYTITLPGAGPPVSDKLAVPGPIRREITISKEAKPSDVTLQIEVQDSAGATAGVKSDRPLKVGGT